MGKGKPRVSMIDPTYTDSRRGNEDEWVPIRPGTDAALVEGMAYVMIKETLVDQAFLDKYCVGYDEKTLPKGYDTELNDRSSLSAGQRQLLTIARAMVENAPMIILDDATTSVDTRTEVLVQKEMDRITRGRTSFVIAHRLSTIRDADLILVMDKGDIVESGTHEQLLEKGGLYKELYTSQFENK